MNAPTADVSRFRVEGMDCPACVAKVETATRRVTGVEDVAVSLSAGTMVVRHVGAVDLAEIQRRLRMMGYEVQPDAGRPADRFKADTGLSTPPKGASDVETSNADDAPHGHHHDGHRHDDADHQDDDHHRREGRPNAAVGVAKASMSAPASHAELHGHAHDHGDEGRAWWSTRRFRLAAAAGIALIAAYAVGQLSPTLGHWPFVVAMLVGLVPVARRAIASVRFGSPFSIEMLMTIAAVGAVFIGAAEEAAMVVLLFLIGEMLEGVAAGRARSSITALASLVPKTAHVERDGRAVEVPADLVAVGSIILIRPGDRVPADGVVVSGESAIDEAPVTGESMAVAKAPGDAVFAGTINGDGVLRVRSTTIASDNTIARVVRLVEEAQESKAPTERFIDRFSRYYTPGVLAVGALVAIVPPLLGGIWSEWIYKGLAILLIGCPCALVISTPAAIAAGLAAGARRGLLMKGGAVLEGLGTLTAIAFDKTGTLTEGKPRVTDVIGLGLPASDVLRLAGSLETGSSHPLARAILDRATSDGITVASPESSLAVPGKGVEGTVDAARLFLGSPPAAAERAAIDDVLQARIAVLHDEGKTLALLVANGRIGGLIAIRDEPRQDSASALAELGELGIGTVMLTGDNKRTAAAVGESLGIEARGELLPADKMRIVEQMKARGDRVGKVGDGINDAPALAAADIGIAMGGGTDVALETADAASLHSRMRDIPAMVRLSRATMGNIRQNLVLALGLKAVFLVTTLIGVTGLWPAILADTGATVLVTANAMRLLSWRPRT